MLPVAAGKKVATSDRRRRNVLFL